MTPAELLERNLLPVVFAMKQETGTACAFDRAAVAWLEAHALGHRDAPPEKRAALVPMLGTFLGHCFVTTYGGEWMLVSESFIAVKLAPNLMLVPWEKVLKFLGGDDTESFLTFFDLVGQDYVGKTYDGPTFLK